MKTINQTINLNGFVSNIEIEPDEYLLPLQEVIVNSIQSIEDKQNTYKSSIGINIIRNTVPVLSEEEFEEPYHPIMGFEVTDNGVGFTEKRFDAPIFGMNILFGIKLANLSIDGFLPYSSFSRSFFLLLFKIRKVF